MKLIASLAGCVLASSASLAPAAAQSPGTVLYYQKINTKQGNGPPGVDPDDQFGRGSCVVGDVDLDGVQDLVVGALGDDDGDSNAGAVWVLFMNTNGTVKSRQKISQTRGGFTANLDADDEFGRAVREIGDFDQDGVPDIAVSADFDDDGDTDAGALYLLYLMRDGTCKSWSKISATSGGFTGNLDNDDQFGRGMRQIGDLDLDGVEDLAVGSPHDDDGGSNRGAVWILFMKRDGTVKSHKKISSTSGNLGQTLSDGGEFGFDCAVVGDRDGDGVQDLVYGSPDQKTDGIQQGAVFVLFMKSDGTVKSSKRITEAYSGFPSDPLDTNDEFGCAVESIGDIDGDGIGDLAVGAGKDDDGPSGAVDRGAVYILFLNQDCTVRGIQKISAVAGGLSAYLGNGGRFGTSLAYPGDHDRDGWPDLFVGCRFDSESGPNSGAEFFLALVGSPTTAPVAQFTAAPASGIAPLSVQFSDLSTGQVTSWDWSLGDGATSTEQNPSHVYEDPGSYAVSLTVTGPFGSDIETKASFVVVTDGVPGGITRLGCGTNPVGSLSIVSGSGRIGETMIFGLDNPLGTQGPNSRTYLWVSNAPDPAFPCGTLIPNVGMEAAGSSGEQLLLTSAPYLLATIIGSTWNTAGVPATANYAIANDAALIGVPLYFQGYIVDRRSTYGIRSALTDGFEIVISP
jgi:PKD repeat protein